MILQQKNRIFAKPNKPQMQNEKGHITVSPTPSEELYRFGADGNLRMYSYDRLFYSLYGYNGGTTRTYKYSFNLNPNWVNGRLETVNFNMHNAMFYPNSYLNFNANGYYTKHYYNGMERIASRLGDQNLSINVNDPELQDRKEWQDSLIRKQITEITGYEFLPVGEEQTLDDPKPVFELPQIGLNNLIPNTSSIYYYHPNHLGSTCYVTDENASVVQGFLYAPFGEITNEYNISFGSSVLPKYSFNAKELDEETGMYYYEARYMAPPVFISRDPLFEKYPTFSPYAYCANNPVKYVDPTGEEIGKIYNQKGKQIGDDGKDNNIVYLCYTEKDIQLTKEQSTLFIMFGVAVNITKKTGLTNDELNLRASLSMLKQAEAGKKNPPLDYNSWNGNDKFTNNTYKNHPEDYKRHPGENPKTGRTAAGAYQFIEKSYTQEDFSPQSQDKAAVKLMTPEGYDAALSGDMNIFKSNNNKRWTSLNHWSAEDLQEKFYKYRANELLGVSKIASPIGALLRH